MLEDILEKLPTHLKNAFPIALQNILDTPNVLGVVWAGSAALGNADEHSDLDFYVLMGGSFRHRTSSVVHGAPVEAFFNPAHQVRKNILAGESSGLFMLTEGVVVHDHPELQTLIAEAKQRLSSGRETKPATDFYRHMATDSVWEARSCVHDPVHVQVVADSTDMLTKILYQQRGYWDVKTKYILEDLEKHDVVLAEQLKNIFLSTDGPARQAHLEMYASTILGNLDWFTSSTVPEEV